MRFGVAARVHLGVALRLNPHLVTGEETEDALLSWLWSCTTAVNALRCVVSRVVLWLFVGADVALVVAQYHLVIAVRDQVVRHHRDLAAATRRVNHKRWHGIARSVSAQAFDDLEPLPNWGTEVARTFNKVALIDVVRADAILYELVHQLAHDVHAVVHASKEHRLIPNRDASARQLVYGARNFWRDLLRMIEVQVHPERVVLGEHRAEFIVNALRHEDGHARANADDFNMRDVSKTAEDPLKEFRRKGEPVAAADQYVAHLWCASQIVELRFVIFGVEVLRWVTNDARTCAVAAIRCALRGDEHQHAIWVAVHKARNWRVAIFAE